MTTIVDDGVSIGDDLVPGESKVFMIAAGHRGVARQTAQMAALQKQLDEAKQQVQDIAVMLFLVYFLSGATQLKLLASSILP